MSNNSNNHHRNNNQQKEPAIRKFTLGAKELEGKNTEFEYDRGLYLIYDIVGEEKTEVFRSRNMQEAYTKWNVYIGRKKERPSRKRDEEVADEPKPEITKEPKKEKDSKKNESHHNQSHRNRNRNRSNKPKQN